MVASSAFVIIFELFPGVASVKVNVTASTASPALPSVSKVRLAALNLAPSINRVAVARPAPGTLPALSAAVAIPDESVSPKPLTGNRSPISALNSTTISESAAPVASSTVACKIAGFSASTGPLKAAPAPSSIVIEILRLLVPSPSNGPSPSVVKIIEPSEGVEMVVPSRTVDAVISPNPATVPGSKFAWA